MKSSFSWPGRPPAEMISRNVKRLLTSILDGRLKRGAFYTSTLDGTLKRGAFYTSTLDGTPKRGAFCTSTLDGTLKRGAFYTSTLDGTLKRGAFCTSTLDGTLKRGAFCTSTLDGTPKRGAFCTSTLDGRLKRDAFLCTRVGTYCIRPTKRSRKGTRSAKGGQTHDSLSPTGPFSGAYAIRPYHATSKRDAFLTSYLVATLKRGAFSCTRVGAYCIRPTKRSRKGTGSAKGDQTCDFLSPTGPFGGAYAIRPYHATSKRDAFCTSYLVATPKRGAFCTSTLDGRLKRDAFLCTRVGAYCIRPTKRSRKGTRSAKGDQTCDFLSPTGQFDRAYAIRPYDGTSKEGAFASSFSIVVFSSSIFLCLNSLFSSGRSSSRCSVTCAP